MNRFFPVSWFSVFAAWILVVCALTFNATPAGAAATFTSLYSFPLANVNNDGGKPFVLLFRGNDGNFYGTTESGGTAGYGTVFKLTPAGTLTTLVNFTNANGSSPDSLIQGNDGNFYGTTALGGTGGDGTVFRLTTVGMLTTLVNFTEADGISPTSIIQGIDGNFYGMTNHGGSSGVGTVFKVTPAGTLTTLVNFNFVDGGLPSAGLVQGSDGNFYGTTYQGGTAGTGTVFKVTPMGTLTTLHSFSMSTYNGGKYVNSDGNVPIGNLIQGSDGNFYGTTTSGGTSGYGTVFKLTSAGTFTPLANFTNANGAFATTMTQGTDGNFYGTTQAGGSFGAGTAFSITPSGTLMTLFNFDGSGHGSSPNALILGADGNFYGSTLSDGDVGTGTIFKMTTAGSVTSLHVFSEFNNESARPDTASFVQGQDGNFYGVTVEGGSFGAGSVFKTTPSGGVTTIFSFDGDLNEGIDPEGLVQGRDGNLYGTTRFGGANGSGTVFKVTTTGVLTTLYTFSNENDGVNSDGAYPRNRLVQGSDESFYGTTQGGGSFERGTVFKMTATGALTTLANLTSTSGTELNSLIQGSDGNFYGTAAYGGANNSGTIFKVTPAGSLTVLYNFSGTSYNGSANVNSDGANPGTSLVQGSDGNFYGTATYGGTNGNGTVFKITPTGVLTALYDFISLNGAIDKDAGFPIIPLVQGRDGSFYGTTQTGGSGDSGTVFSITSSGMFTTLYNFGGSDGSDPNALVLGSDGSFYGTTSYGGNTGYGTIFRLSVSSASTPTWTCKDVAAASDGTARMLWDRSDGAAGIWALNANDAQTSYGPTYGPFADTHGTWSAKAVSAASDGNTKMLWTRSDGAAGVWTLNAAGTQTAVGPTYGPYSDSHGTWSAADIAAGPGGTTKMLWTRSDGGAGMWTLNTTNTQTVVGPAYGPFAGWSAKAVGASGDGTAHILWINVNRTAGLWTLNASDVETSTGTVYGPYSDSHGTWSAGDMATNSDGTSNVLWNRSDGAAGVWTFSAPGVQAKVGPVYGPYTGFTAAALDAASDQSRVLWIKSNRAAGLWSFNAADTATISGTVYGPY